ncbi:MAG: DUF362 domain-containing protein [Dictyoglomus sp.]|nr:DUF362 domain-containing protein [Dictyoglomus sp.]MDW8188250.1 DUF362 domain-containing protein [Dictyoglomus sp.]
MKKEKIFNLGLGIAFLISQSFSKIEKNFVKFDKVNNLDLNRIVQNLSMETKEIENQKISEVVPVGIAKERDIKQSVRTSVYMVGGLNFINPGDTVLIKPNVNSDDPYPGTTNPQVLEEVILMVKERGAKRIIVADCSGIPWPNTMRNMERVGIAQVAKKLGVELYALDNMEWIWVKPEKAKYWSNGFRIPKIVKEVDHIINVAVVKTHSITDFTMSLKNFVGLIHRQDRMIMHGSRYIKEMIAELNLAFNPALNILDASRVFVRGGPAKGEVREPMMIIASPDRIACDIVGLSLLKILGTTPEIQDKNMWDHPQIKRAVEVGIGIKNPEKIILKGSQVDIEKFEKRLK